MVKIPKPGDEDLAFFRSLVPDHPDVAIKPMFGNVAAFVHGNMFMGLFGPDVGVRLGDEARAELLEHDGAGAFGPPERPMREYVSLPRAWRRQPDRAAAWVDRALGHTAAMPPKRPRS